MAVSKSDSHCSWQLLAGSQSARRGRCASSTVPRNRATTHAVVAGPEWSASVKIAPRRLALLGRQIHPIRVNKYRRPRRALDEIGLCINIFGRLRVVFREVRVKPAVVAITSEKHFARI